MNLTFSVQPEPTSQTREPRMRYIDALRGVAALLVAWLHAVYAFGHLAGEGHGSGGWLTSIVVDIDVGHVGVVVFFLISGFVIPFSIQPGSSAPASSFLIKRFFRIFPAYWLSVPLAVIACFWIWRTPFSMREFLINLTLLQDFFGVRSAEGVYWTLPVEIVFYLICVVLLKTASLFDTRRTGALALLLLVMFAALLPKYGLIRPPVEVTTAFWCLNLSVMLWGTLYRSRCDATTPADQRANGWLVGGLLIGYLLALPAFAQWIGGYVRNEILTYVIGFAIFIVGTRVVRIETRLTDWLGRISYSIYLFHNIVFLTIEWILLKQPVTSWWRTQYFGLYMLVGVLITLVVASLVYRCIERPGIRLGHRLAAQWQARSARTPAVAPDG